MTYLYNIFTYIYDLYICIYLYVCNYIYIFIYLFICIYVSMYYNKLYVYIFSLILSTWISGKFVSDVDAPLIGLIEPF